MPEEEGVAPPVLPACDFLLLQLLMLVAVVVQLEMLPLVSMAMGCCCSAFSSWWWWEEGVKG